MKLENEKKECFYKYDIDLQPEEYKMLKEYGLKHIVDDPDALINYAVIKILKESIEDTGKLNNVMKKLIKKEKKNGKSNS